MDRILGRILEGLGIGLFSGGLLTLSIKDMSWWYWVPIGIFFIVYGVFLQRKKD